MRFFCQLSRQHPLQSHDQPPNLFMFVSFLKPRSCLAIFWKCSLCHHNCITNPSNPANQQQTGSPNKQCQPLAVSFWRFITNKKTINQPKGNQIFHLGTHINKAILPLPYRGSLHYTWPRRSHGEVLMGATSQEIRCPNVCKWIPSTS